MQRKEYFGFDLVKVEKGREKETERKRKGNSKAGLLFIKNLSEADTKKKERKI